MPRGEPQSALNENFDFSKPAHSNHISIPSYKMSLSALKYILLSDTFFYLNFLCDACDKGDPKTCIVNCYIRDSVRELIEPLRQSAPTLASLIVMFDKAEGPIYS